VLCRRDAISRKIETACSSAASFASSAERASMSAAVEAMISARNWSTSSRA